jgi:hypothetical protein
MTEAKDFYCGTLNDLYSQRVVTVRRLSDIDQAISSLQRVMKTAGIVAEAPPTPVPVLRPTRLTRISPTQTTPGRRFSFMSVRWAILILLDEAKTPMTQAEISEALEAEGIRAKSKATNFGNNVSAVLSNMRSPRNEIEVKDGRYQITANGRSGIHHIKLTRGIA